MRNTNSRPEVSALLEGMRQPFLDFQSARPQRKSRRYPEGLKELARQAHQQGASVREIGGAIGVAVSALHKWVGPLRGARGIRKLKVVGEPAGSQSVVVVLPSGVRIELGGVSDLSGQFLHQLASLGRAI